MHSAPAVSYPIRRSRFHGILLAAILVGAALVLTLWIMQMQTVQVQQLVAVLLWMVTSGLAAWGWWHSPTGMLTWDGLGWIWFCREQSVPVVPEVSLDLQGNLLLHLHADSARGSVWIWPEHRLMPQRWLAFRRAVFGKVPTSDARSTGLFAAPDASA